MLRYNRGHMARVATFVAAGIGALLASGCSGLAGHQEPGDDDWQEPEQVARTRSGIINGQVDTTHAAVVAAFGSQSGCTATIIHKAGSVAYALSAGHCFELDPMQAVAVGTDYQAADDVLNVTDWQQHPNYNPNSQSYDFAVMTLSGASASTPTIPAMRPADDNVDTGSSIEHVGYGILQYPSGGTTVRHHSMGSCDQTFLSQLGLSSSLYVGYLQNGSGPCSGDSGGPNLADPDGSGQRVAGVISFGDQECAQFGVSGRVSAVYDDFIAPYIGNPPPTTSSSGAGGGSSAASSGSGTSGAGAGTAAWVAPGTVNQDFDGSVVSSRCSLGPGSLGPGWLGPGWLGPVNGNSASILWWALVLSCAARTLRRRR